MLSQLIDELQGKYVAMLICWVLGIGCLFPWNSVLTVEDYFSYLFPVCYVPPKYFRCDLFPYVNWLYAILNCLFIQSP